MPRLTLALIALLFASIASAADTSATITCIPPTKNTDGSTLDDLSGFKLYGGLQGRAKNLLATAGRADCRFVRTNLAAGTQEYFVTAVTSGGAESDPSNVVSKVITADPVPTCPAQPAAESRQQACVAPTVGNWMQTRGFTSIAAPACWEAGIWLPTQAPEGVCASPPPPTLTTADTKAYEQRSATLPLALIGVTRVGQPCGPETLVRNGIRYCRVPLWSATGVPQVLPVVWMQNLLGTEFWVRTSQ